MKRSWRLVLAGGVVAGTLDIVYACVFWAIKRGIAPQRVLQRVASGLLGEASLTGGWATAALGLVCHYLIATLMAVTYYFVARRWPALWERPLPYGAAYGLLLYGIMNYVVVPLSAAGPSSRDTFWIAMSIVVHMFLIGVPCAVFARLAVLADLRTPAPAFADNVR